MKTIESEFNRDFSSWQLALPSVDSDSRKSGTIIAAGWVIWYLLGADADGEYLDYYAAHRMTDDRHIRIYENGFRKSLPAIQSFRLISPDPAKDAQNLADYYAENQRITAMLEEKGFHITGNEPGGVQINRFLHLHPHSHAPHDT